LSRKPKPALCGIQPYQIDAQNWSSVVLNSLVKVSKNEVITFERLKISLKSFMGPVGFG
jgi:hypothetical protein